ncbi:MAG TPA: LysR family transcriptional regulator [Thermoanaerobaculia bacterium]|nr:LysR family transcriptional regulator [Thermoanaerobaculia bacterium]
MPRPPARLLPRIRVMQGAAILLGPGKADLLEAIARRGTIRDAAKALGMSYMRAWKLVQVMNEAFREPLVVVHRGGAGRGSSELTETGEAVLRLYRELETDALKATKKRWAELQRLVRRDT